MDTEGSGGWRLCHSPPLTSQLAPANVFTIFDKIKGMKQIPASKFCSLPSVGPRGPAVKS